MKICYLSSARIPTEWAHVLQILHMCEAYALEGHEVTLLCPRWLDPNVGGDAYAFGRVKKNFKIVRLPIIDLFPGTPRRIFFRLRTLSFLLVAKIYILFNQFDLIVTREYGALFFFKNCIYEIHMPPKVKTGNESLIGRALGLVVLTSGIRDFYTARGVSLERIHISPDAVDPAVFEIPETREEVRAKFGLDPDAFIVGYAGTLRAMGHEKGIGTLIEAMKKTNPGVIACIFGGERQHVEEYKKRAQDAGVSDRMHFFGHIPHDEVPLAMRAFDCAVVPILDVEIYRLYTSPLKVFEYMAARVPMIVSDLPSLRDVLDESLAVFVPPGNGIALAGAIETLRHNPAAALARAVKAQVLVKEKFTWRARARAVVDFGERLKIQPRSYGN